MQEPGVLRPCILQSCVKGMGHPADPWAYTLLEASKGMTEALPYNARI